MQFSCCHAVIDNVVIKDIMRNKKWERLKWKYQNDNGTDSCLCKVKVFAGVYHNSTTKTTTDMSSHTFTYLTHDNSNKRFTDDITNHVNDDVTDANENVEKVTDVVTDMKANVTTDDLTNAHLSKVRPNGSPKVITDKDNRASDGVIDFDEINVQVTDKVIDVVGDEVNKVKLEDEDLTTLSDTTTTEENVSIEEITIKYRHVSDLQKLDGALEHSEIKSDNNYDPVNEYAPDDSPALQQLVSFLYQKNNKNNRNAESLELPESIESKKRATRNLIKRKEIAAKPIKKPIIYHTIPQKSDAKSITKKSGIMSKPSYKPVIKSKYEKYYRSKDLVPDYSDLKINRDIFKDMSSDNSYFETNLNSLENMRLTYQGREEKFTDESGIPLESLEFTVF